MGTAVLMLTTLAPVAAAQEAGVASAWTQAQMAQVRLVAGKQAGAAGGSEIVAGVEIALEDGWKTYWRNPGDAGGVPPELGWSNSENVAETKLLYPAPKRFKDKTGETIGYKGSVVLPVIVRADDPSRAVNLQGVLNFGICREICVPVTAELRLTVPADLKPGLPPVLRTALEQAPRGGDAIKAGDPKLVSHEVVLDGDKPRIVLNVDLGAEGETGTGDVFAEASDGVYLPMPQRADGRAEGPARFEIDLTAANDPQELKGKTIRVTMIGPKGQSEASFVVD